MKRFLQASLTVLTLLVGFQMLQATCVTPLALQAPGGYPYEVAYTTGPNDQCYIYYVDKSGNQAQSGNLTVLGSVTTTGSQTLTGLQAFSPTSQLGLSTTSTISPTATYMLLTSTGGTVTLGQGAPYVAIATATAVNGQILILGSTVPLSGASISLTSGTASGLDLGAATRAINYGKKLGLIYDSLTSMWTELFYGNN